MVITTLGGAGAMREAPASAFTDKDQAAPPPRPRLEQH